MEFNSLVEAIIAWCQTPLGANIVGPLVVAAIIGIAVVSRKFFASIPGRLFRWMERRAGQLDAVPPLDRQLK